MNTSRTSDSITLPPWAYPLAEDSLDLASRDLRALGEHLGLCKSPHRHLFALHCAAQTMHGFIVSRFVTSLVLLGLLTVFATWVL